MTRSESCRSWSRPRTTSGAEQARTAELRARHTRPRPRSGRSGGMIARLAGVAAALILGGASLVAAETKNIDRTVPLTPAGTVTLAAPHGALLVRNCARP